MFLFLLSGDLCAWRLVSLQSSTSAGGPGGCELLLPAVEPACGDEAQKDAVQVEGDGRQVRKDLTHTHAHIGEGGLSLLPDTPEFKYRPLQYQLHSTWFGSDRFFVPWHNKLSLFFFFGHIREMEQDTITVPELHSVRVK